jgi:hypothetical protein
VLFLLHLKGLGNGWYCSRTGYADNIGERSFESRLAFEPIDVVYTWVNGSDPVFKEEKDYWKQRWLEKEKGIKIYDADTNDTVHDTGDGSAENLQWLLAMANISNGSNGSASFNFTNTSAVGPIDLDPEKAATDNRCGAMQCGAMRYMLGQASLTYLLAYFLPSLLTYLLTYLLT